MKPSIENFLDSSAIWRGEHLGISYKLSWHGRSEYQPEGTWCWYLLLPQEQFTAEDWKILRLEHEDRDFSGSFRRHYAYENFPDVEPHGGWTYGEMETYLGRYGKEYERVEVGCDYAHSWDRDGNFWQGKEDIERDAKHSIALFVKMFPNIRERCRYSGKWADIADMYTAKNGSRVCKDQIEKLRADKTWSTWLPAEAA